MRSQNGFTLVEIVIVVFIIGLLASVAIPNFLKARTETQKNICIGNLWEIEGAKEQWALMNNEGDVAANADRGNRKKGKGRRKNRNTGDPVDEDEVNALLKGGAPLCPAGGKYTYGVLGVKPRCSLGKEKGHILP